MKKGNRFLLKNRRGQIWIETVIYTLVALVMIGLVLSFARPKIQELQDKAIIDQSINMMKEIDDTISNLGNQGNKRIIEIGIKKGDLTLDEAGDLIFFGMESASEYSEIGKEINDGNVVMNTSKKGSVNFVNLTLDYSGVYDLEIVGTENKKILPKASIPYKISIENQGGNPVVINLAII
jgi:uncharacterized protein (UPF0333 family)